MKCSYCSAEIKRGTGLLYVYKTGNTSYYCSNRCFKNDIEMGRKINQKLVRRNAKASAPAGKAQSAERKPSAKA